MNFSSPKRSQKIQNLRKASVLFHNLNPQCGLYNYVKELGFVKKEEGCQTLMIFLTCSHKSFTEVNL